jgi:hypothetical protein
VAVFHDPANPRNAVLERQAHGNNFALILGCHSDNRIDCAPLQELENIVGSAMKRGFILKLLSLTALANIYGASQAAKPSRDYLKDENAQLGRYYFHCRGRDDGCRGIRSRRSGYVLPSDGSHRVDRSNAIRREHGERRCRELPGHQAGTRGI